MKVGALSDVSEKKDAATFIEGLFESRYLDLIILLIVVFTFLILIVASAAST
jgi:hypothetical protein